MVNKITILAWTLLMIALTTTICNGLYIDDQSDEVADFEQRAVDDFELILREELDKRAKKCKKKTVGQECRRDADCCTNRCIMGRCGYCDRNHEPVCRKGCVRRPDAPPGSVLRVLICKN
ncbi:unnamed protein product [Adineta ricciae]|uniref:Uncharacterized protein n=1 Tax=Adineta ricciae TaxID=249248 RepID=A0A815VDQ4_ADIRI|nr:unnamed protein product [Adineta ricciae]CAF1529210.1 unnamed protein product [Adineta ricciae]